MSAICYNFIMFSVQKLFSNIADIYDPMNHLLTFGADKRWRRVSAGLLPRKNTERILDLACGTGDFCAELLRRFPDAKITGADLTPAMLKIAERKLRGRKNISLECSDAQNLDRYECAFFDIVSCAFGFRNFPNRDIALKEASRVLKPGGHLLVLEFFKPPPILGRITGLWLKTASKIFAGKSSGAYAYLRASMDQMISIYEFTELAERHQLKRCKVKKFFPAASVLLFTRQ